MRMGQGGARVPRDEILPKIEKKMTKPDEIYQKYTKNCHVLKKNNKKIDEN